MKPLILVLTAFMALTANGQKPDDEPGFEHMTGLKYTTAGHKKQVVCYWGTWANYRPDAGKFTPEDVDPSLCTNLIYSFAGLDSQSWTIKSLDPWMDLGDNYGLDGFKKATDLKYSNTDLKVTLAIGGWNEGSKKYSEMAADPAKRRTFVKSAVEFLQKYRFDGLDLDWEYPAKRGGAPEDKENFIHLIRELRQSFDKHNFLLTAAIGAAASTIDVAYDIPLMYKYLDYVHVMCYDYHGKWDKKTGHNAPLRSQSGETGSDVFLNIDYTWNFLKKKGALAEKTVLGVPLYGRAFKLENPHDHGLNAKSQAISFQGPYTREDGFLGYNEICEELTIHETEGWTREWADQIDAPYMYNELRWVSYDDRQSIRIKSEYAYNQGLAGVMTWSIDTDDFRGTCGNVKFPLLRAINHALYSGERGLTAGAARPGTFSAALGLALSLFALFRNFN